MSGFATMAKALVQTRLIEMISYYRFCLINCPAIICSISKVLFLFLFCVNTTHIESM